MKRCRLWSVAWALLLCTGTAFGATQRTGDGYTWTYERVGTAGVRITGVMPDLEGNVAFPRTLGGRTVVDVETPALQTENVTALTVPASLADSEVSVESWTAGYVEWCGEWREKGEVGFWWRLCTGFPKLERVMIDGVSTRWKEVDESVYSCDGTVLVFHPQASDTLTLTRNVVSITAMLSVKVSVSGMSSRACGPPDDYYERYSQLDSVQWVVADNGDVVARLSGFGDFLSDGWELLTPGGYPFETLTLTKDVAGSAFRGCSTVTTLALDEGVQALGWRAFGECGNLTAVEGGTGVKVVNTYAFSGTPFFENQTGFVRFGNWIIDYRGEFPATLVIPDGVTGANLSLDDSVLDLTVPASLRDGTIEFRGDTVRVSSVTSWINRTFKFQVIDWYSCYGEAHYKSYDLYANGRLVRDVTIPGSMRKVPEDLFRHCRSLQSVTFEEGVETIGREAFFRCQDLLCATFPDSLRIIGASAFEGCWNLTFTLPSQVDAIGLDALADTSSYEQAIAEAQERNQVAYLGNWAIGWPWDDEEDNDCPVSVTIRNGTRGIMSDAFLECSSLQCVNLPTSLQSVEDDAFRDTGLTSVTLPTGLKRIGDRAFASLKLSTLPKLPASLEEIGECAFSGDGSGSEEDTGISAWYAKHANGWIVANGWLLGYKNADYVWDEEEEEWCEDESGDEDTPPLPKTLVVPTTVKHIAGFRWPEEEEGEHELILPNKLETISSYAFYDLELSALTIPASVKRIGLGAFYCAEGPIVFMGRPPVLYGEGEECDTFEWADVGYFIAGTPGWTNGMTYAGLTMEARMLVGGKLVPGVSIALDIVGEGTATGCEKEVYAAGTKLNLRAKPAAGFYFAGWEVDGQTVSTSASFPYTVPDVEDGVRLTARFVFDAIDFEPVDDVACDAGEEIEVPIFCMSGTPMTYKIANLPKGVKLDEKSMTISGTPTVPGVYTVALTATNKNKNVATLTFRISVANFRADWFDVDEVLGFVPGVAIEPISLDGCGLDFENGETLSVVGLPRGLSYDAKAHEVKGRPTQPGTYTVTFTGKVKLLDERGRTVTVTDIATATWTVWPLPTLTLTPVSESGEAGGTVRGGGAYLAGTKATLRAVAAKGYVFAGWEGLDAARVGGTDPRSPTLRYTTDAGDEEVFARFVSRSEDAGSLGITVGDPKAAVLDYDEDDEPELQDPWDGTVYVGTMMTQQIEVASLSLPSVSVSGLPPGLRFNRKTYEITGVPTRAGVFTVTIRASNGGGARLYEQVAYDVRPLPDWAVGTFTGGLRIHLGDCEDYVEHITAVVNLDVARTGRISGRVRIGQASFPITASCYNRYERGVWNEGGDQWNKYTQRFETVPPHWEFSPGFATEVKFKWEGYTFTVPIKIEEDEDGVGEGKVAEGEVALEELPDYQMRVIGPNGVFDNHVSHFVLCLGDIRQTVVGRTAELFGRFPVQTLTVDDDDEEEGIVTALTLRTSANGRVTFAGRVNGHAVTGSAAFIWYPGGTDSQTGKKYEDIFTLLLYAPPRPREGFAGLFGTVDCTIDFGSQRIVVDDYYNWWDLGA